MNKKLINVFLGLCAVGLLFITWRSIQDTEDFDADVKARENVVKARLMEIREAQEAYKAQHGEYCPDWSVLIQFVKTGRLPIVMKQGVLTDKQMDNGLTESKAAEIVASGDQAAIAANGLQNFRRDTNWIAVADTIFGKGFNPDSLRYVPFGNGAVFEMDTITQIARSGAPFCLLEVKVPYTTYLNGLDEQEINNLIYEQNQLGRYAGLKIGDLETANNNAGNWE